MRKVVAASTKGVHSVTLCRFDDKSGREAKSGPFIPCERRLALEQILEIQGRDFEPVFESGSMAGLINEKW